mgnify:CR=1 FL=1
MSRFNPYVVAGSIMALAGAYSISDEFQLVPKIILIIGMVLMIYGYDKIDKALRIYRKMEGRNKRNGRSKEYVRFEQTELRR